MLTSVVPTFETLAFVKAHVPLLPSRILEIGCGDGALAARLQAMGHQIIGDCSKEVGMVIATRTILPPKRTGSRSGLSRLIAERSSPRASQ